MLTGCWMNNIGDEPLGHVGGVGEGSKHRPGGAGNAPVKMWFFRSVLYQSSPTLLEPNRCCQPISAPTAVSAKRSGLPRDAAQFCSAEGHPAAVPASPEFVSRVGLRSESLGAAN